MLLVCGGFQGADPTGLAAWDMPHACATKAPKDRLVKRVADLTPEEASDLFRTTQLISGRIEARQAATSLTLTLQDGPEAGQTVPHVHFHVIPRVAGDWLNNDDIYADVKASERAMARGGLSPLFFPCAWLLLIFYALFLSTYLTLT